VVRLLHRLSYALYRVLLLAYPREFRERDGPEAATLFAEACVESFAERRPAAALRRQLRACMDVPRGGLAERLRRSRAVDGGMNGGIAGLGGDLRHAARSLRRRPALGAGIVATLAVAIGVNTAMFSVVDTFLLRPSPYRDADRLVVVRARDGEPDRLRDPTIGELQGWMPAMTSFERVEARRWRSVIVTGADHAARERVLEVTPGYLSTLGLLPIAGRLIQPADARPGAPPVAVLSERTWRRLFGGRDVIGRTIGVDGETHTIVGVCPEIVSDTPGLRFAVVAPLPSGPEALDAAARGIAWLRPGVTLPAARAELRSVVAAFDQPGQTVTAELALPDNVFWNVREFRDPQLALTAGVLVLLLIAAVNVTMLLLARGESRRTELVVRRALGASRRQLARLLAIESILLALAGGVLGLFVALFLTRVVASLDPGSAQLQTRLEIVRLNGIAYVFGLALALATGALVGLLPALRASRASEDGLRRAADGRTPSRRRSSRVFVGLQVGLCMVLLVAATLVGRSFLDARLADRGFDADRIFVLQIALPRDTYPTVDRRDAFFRNVLARAARLPGVTGATLGYGAAPPTDILMRGAVQLGGATRPDEWLPVGFVRPGYFDLMGIPLVEGRGFAARDIGGQTAGSSTPVVLSRSLADSFWPGGPAVGQVFDLEDRRGTRRFHVIGIASDTMGRGDLLNIGCAACRWQLYAPLPAERQYTEVILRLADGAPPPIAALQAAIRDVDPGVPADDELGTAADRLVSATRRQEFNSLLFGAFALLAISLAAEGLFAMVFQSVAERTREMGIRLALGARPAEVRRLVLRQGLLPALAGVCAGGLAATALARTMTSFLYGTDPLDAGAYAASAALLLTVSLAAASVPAWRASHVRPIDVIRAD
jgi:predicted permease